MRDANVRLVGWISNSSKTEIGDLYFTRETEQDVFWLDVSMNDTTIAGLLKCRRDLTHEIDDDCNAECSACCQQLLQILARHVLLNEEVNPVDTVDTVNLNDVCKYNRSDGLCFVVKAANVTLVAGQSGVQSFESDLAMQRFLFRKIDVRHAAASQLAKQEIITKLAA